MYELTDEGLQALRDWAGTPLSFTPLKSEMLVRMLAADLVGERAVRESMASLRADLDDLEQRLAEAEASAETLPHRRTYLLLITGFMRRLFALHRDFAGEVEKELAQDSQ